MYGKTSYGINPEQDHLIFGETQCEDMYNKESMTSIRNSIA